LRNVDSVSPRTIQVEFGSSKVDCQLVISFDPARTFALG
jgi:hypothetical protein